MLKVLQARLQQYMNQELSDVQAGIKLLTLAKKLLLLIDYAKAFDCVDYNKLWKILQEIGMPDHLTCLLRNLYAGQEATVRMEHGTTDWFQIRKGVHKAVYCHPAYLTFMQSTSCEMLGWMKHKLESRFLEKYQ